MSVLRHTEDLQKLCRICCQFLGKGSYCKEKHHENIKHFLSIQETTILLTPRQNLPEMLLCYVCCY